MRARIGRLNAPLLVISFFLAITLWAVVRVQDMQPETRDLTAMVKDSYLDTRLVITKMQQTVKVTAEGPKENVNDPGLSHLVAVVDLHNATVGTHNYPARIVAPGTDLLQYLTSTKLSVSVTIEPKRHKLFKVTVEPRGSLADRTLKLESAKPTPGEITYSGPESQIASIAKVRVTPDLGDAEPDKPQDTLFEAPVALDKSNRPVEGVDPSVPLISVQIRLIVADVDRTVVVNPQIVGQVPAGYALDSYSRSPQTVTVRGDATQIGQLTSVDTMPIDLGKITRSGTVSVGVQLPSGVSLVDDQTIAVTFVVHASTASKHTSQSSSTSSFPDHVPPLEPAKKGGR